MQGPYNNIFVGERPASQADARPPLFGGPRKAGCDSTERVCCYGRNTKHILLVCCLFCAKPVSETIRIDHFEIDMPWLFLKVLTFH